MGRIVIVAYRPKPGKDAELQALMREHLARLRRAGLVTDRESIMMQARDGTIVEVFEWKSRAAIDAAHQHPEVLAMWSEYAGVCDYVPIGQVPEAAELFSEFTPFS